MHMHMQRACSLRLCVQRTFCVHAVCTDSVSTWRVRCAARLEEAALLAMDLLRVELTMGRLEEAAILAIGYT